VRAVIGPQKSFFPVEDPGPPLQQDGEEGRKGGGSWKGWRGRGYGGVVVD